MKQLLLPIAFLLTVISAGGQTDIDYYLPKNTNYNPAIPAPEEFAGHKIGEFHLSHDKLYYYMTRLAELSDRAVWEEYGRSYEKRPLGHLIISSPANIKDLEQIRLRHLKLSDPDQSSGLNVKEMPVIIKLGYGVHGNESSAQNSSVLVAYYLVAGESNDINELLENAVILIDPSLNPDGMQRHSSWVNSSRSHINNPDPASWEFMENWPGGRTNHYWFDLNRDYIMLQHPESSGRVAAFHRWKPNINTDHHETGANETFFFQPGIQSRNNPLTPAENQELTAEIGKYHEKYLNAIGSLYFTEESFDDYYLGKGSSYPDIHGSVGILFEQAGVKGHLRETSGGLLSFPFAILNQFTVSLSTLEAGLKMKDKLLTSQRNFYIDAIARADKHNIKAYVFSEPDDRVRTSEFIRILLKHQIKVYSVSRTINKDGIIFETGKSYVVPLKQAEYRFIRSLFEPVRDFTDSTFYDTSTWVLPMAFNIPYAGITSTKDLDGLAGDQITDPGTITGHLISDNNAYAYLFEWNEYFAPRALYALQDAGIRTRVATEGFSLDAGSGLKSFSAGTVLIAPAGQNMEKKELESILRQVAEDCGIIIYGVKTGLTPEGADLGSSRFISLSVPKPMMITGPGISSSDAGEIWHLLDRRFHIPVTLVTSAGLASSNLNRYNVIIIAGSPDLSDDAVRRLKEWNRQGGTLIGYKSGNQWLSKNKFAEIIFVPSVSYSGKKGIYSNRAADNQVHQIPGSIFETNLDLTHPLCFGFRRSELPVFKSSTTVAEPNGNIYNNPVRYTYNPLLSGYCTAENLERIRGSAFASVHNNRIISIYDNTNFRAYWYGTSRIFINAIVFGQIIR